MNDQPTRHEGTADVLGYDEWQIEYYDGLGNLTLDINEDGEVELYLERWSADAIRLKLDLAARHRLLRALESTLSAIDRLGRLGLDPELRADVDLGQIPDDEGT